MFRLSYNSANNVYPDGKEDWFIRDVNLSNEQTAFLANDQQLLDVQRFCTNSELFSVFSGGCNIQCCQTFFFGTYRNLMLETSQGTNPICIGPGVLHKRKLEESYYTLPSSMVKYHQKRGVSLLLVQTAKKASGRQ